MSEQERERARADGEAGGETGAAPEVHESGDALSAARAAIDELRREVEAAGALAREARELAERASAGRRGSLRLAQGTRVEPDAREDLRVAAAAAARSGDRRALLDYLELKRTTA